MYVPVRLMNPDILLPEAPPSDANHFLARYSSNNGTAFGLSRTEALLHALNEAHERDWLSRLFLWAALGDVCPVAGATALHHPSVAALLDSDLAALPPAWVLLDVPSGPVRFCAVVEATPPGTGLSRLGSGASTCPVHALRRAAHEYAQAVALEDESTREEDACIASFLRASPTLAPLAGLEAAARLAHVTPPLATEASRETAEEALHRILHHPRRLPAVAIFHPVGAPADLAGVVCQCYCPGAERFHLIRAGNPVAPMRAFK